MADPIRVPYLRVEVSTAPDPHRLRAAIEAALAGRAAGPGAEAEVGRRVASLLPGDAVTDPEGVRRWR